jgi:hypothetical protein
MISVGQTCWKINKKNKEKNLTLLSHWVRLYLTVNHNGEKNDEKASHRIKGQRHN